VNVKQRFKNIFFAMWDWGPSTSFERLTQPLSTITRQNVPTQLFCPSMPETAGAAAGLVQSGYFLKLHVFHRGHQHLRDAFAAGNAESFLAQVDQEHLDLSAIVRVDGAGRVQAGDAVLGGQAGAGTDLRLEAGGQGDAQAGG